MPAGNAALELLTDRNKLATAVGGVTALFLGIYGAREATRVAGRTIDRWLGTPKLVRETSRFNVWDPKTWGSGSSRAKTFDKVRDQGRGGMGGRRAAFATGR